MPDPISYETLLDHLKDGVCVRLKKGMMEDATVFNTDPGAQAKAFADQGFQWLHCVDLNGAFAGHSANAAAITGQCCCTCGAFF